jgi:hypothetical protein
MYGIGSLFGLSQIILIGITLIILSALGLTSRAGQLPAIPPILVLKRFKVIETPADGAFIDISGRPKGFVAWLLNLLRLDDETRLQLTATTLTVRRASLKGQNLTTIPLSQIGSTLCGFRKPLALLAFGLFFAVGGLLSLLGGLIGLTGLGNRGYGERSSGSEGVAMAVVLLVIAAVLFLLYFLRKEMVIAVGDNSTSRMVGVTFRPSVIEGVTVDINRVIRATELLNRKALEAQLNREAVAPKIPGPSPADLKAGQRAAARPATPRCIGCGAVLEADSQFCAECGRSVEP